VYFLEGIYLITTFTLIRLDLKKKQLSTLVRNVHLIIKGLLGLRLIFNSSEKKIFIIEKSSDLTITN